MWPTAVGHDSSVFKKENSRENTHICNDMYGASTTLTKRLTY
jgi:hypothetical protein